jgi:hypothetical protein
MCQSQLSDPDGDGWGWENNQSCKVADAYLPSCSPSSSDPDRDGWGFENGRSCQMREDSFASCSNLAADPDGDGWGWGNNQSCRVRMESHSFTWCKILPGSSHPCTERLPNETLMGYGQVTKDSLGNRLTKT